MGLSTTKPYPSRYRVASFQRLVARAGRKFFPPPYGDQRTSGLPNLDSSVGLSPTKSVFAERRLDDFDIEELIFMGTFVARHGPTVTGGLPVRLAPTAGA